MNSLTFEIKFTFVLYPLIDFQEVYCIYKEKKIIKNNNFHWKNDKTYVKIYAKFRFESLKQNLNMYIFIPHLKHLPCFHL